MDIAELIWIAVVIFFLYRLFFAPAKPNRDIRYDVPSEPSYDQDETSTSARDDILEEMRTIFGEESTTTKKPELPRQPQRVRKQHQPEQSSDYGESKYARYSGTDFIDPSSETSDVDEALENVNLRSPSAIERNRGKSESFKFLFDQDQIRRGIIISEILAKPKSRRRQNI